MTLLLFLLAACSFRSHCSGNIADKRQTYGSTGPLSNLAAPSIIQQFPAGGPIPHLSYFLPGVPHLFPGRPIPGTFSGGQFLEQLGQGIVNHYTGNFPSGSPVPGQFAGGQLYAPSARPVGSALASIAMYDDLKCVPRLLCELAAGGRPGHSGSKQQDSVLPFINKDTMLSLLTALNFGDTSPLMVFGRAVLLGITAKGDPNTCFSAYPTCPRDPDRLVDYLNNHNGGFFRFFGAHQPYQSSRIQAGLSHFTTTTQPQGIRGNRPLLFPHQITNLKPPLSPSHRDQDFLKREASTARLSLVFPGNGNNRQSKGFNFFNRNATGNSAVKTVSFPRGDDSNPGLHIERPPAEQTKPSVPMTFPDKTGTGDLRLDNNDITGPVISVSPFSQSGSHDETVEFTSKRKDTLKFPQNRNKSGKMKFPKIFRDSLSDNNRNQKEVTSLKFPITDVGEPVYRGQK